MATIALLACGEPTSETAKEPTTPSVETATPATEPKPMAGTDDELTKMQQALIGDVPHSFNDKGVVIFKDFADMQEAFNDYTDHKIISADPLKIELYSVVVPTDLPRNITYAQNRAIIYGVYKTFMHTNADKVTIISHLKAYSTDKPANEPVGTPISVTTTRDKALQVLQTHTTAKTFNDLVQLTPHQYRVQGVLSSDIYDEMAKDETQQAIIKDLQK